MWTSRCPSRLSLCPRSHKTESRSGIRRVWNSWWKCRLSCLRLSSCSSGTLTFQFLVLGGCFGYGGLQGFLPEQSSSLSPAEQIIDIQVPGRGVSGYRGLQSFHPGQSSFQPSVEQIIDIQVPGRGVSGYRGLQSFHPGQSSIQPSVEQIVDIPVRGGGLQDCLPVQGFAASSSGQPEEPFQVGFRTFPQPKKSAEVTGQSSERGGVFCSLTILVLQARLAPIHRLPALGAFHALFLSSSLARDLQHVTWRLICCLLEVGHQQNLDFGASHHLGHLCFSWHVGCNSTTVFCFQDGRFSCRTRDADSAYFLTEITRSSCN